MVLSSCAGTHGRDKETSHEEVRKDRAGCADDGGCRGCDHRRDDRAGGSPRVGRNRHRRAGIRLWLRPGLLRRLRPVLLRWLLWSPLLSRLLRPRLGWLSRWIPRWLSRRLASPLSASHKEKRLRFFRGRFLLRDVLNAEQRHEDNLIGSD